MACSKPAPASNQAFLAGIVVSGPADDPWILQLWICLFTAWVVKENGYPEHAPTFHDVDESDWQLDIDTWPSSRPWPLRDDLEAECWYLRKQEYSNYWSVSAASQIHQRWEKLSHIQDTCFPLQTLQERRYWSLECSWCFFLHNSIKGTLIVGCS